LFDQEAAHKSLKAKDGSGFGPIVAGIVIVGAAYIMAAQKN
jgi:hypothetical protein